MAYASETDVEGLLSQYGDLPTFSTITSAQITAIGISVDGEINACLSGRGLTVPFVSDATSDQDEFAAFLKSTSAEGMAARVLKSIFPAAIGPSEAPAFEFHDRLYRDNLKGLKDGTQIPLSLRETSTSVDPSTMNTRNPDEDEDLGDAANPAFNRAMVDDW